jgi:hypothetical protein
MIFARFDLSGARSGLSFEGCLIPALVLARRLHHREAR